MHRLPLIMVLVYALNQSDYPLWTDHCSTAKRYAGAIYGGFRHYSLLYYFAVVVNMLILQHTFFNQRRNTGLSDIFRVGIPQNGI